MRASRVICLASAAVLSAVLSDRTAAGQGFTDTTRVTAVQIPVQVVADGKPVRGLTAADFLVYEGRRQRPVVGFDTVDLQTLPQGAAVPSAARRYFLMVFDMAFSEPPGIARARQAAIEMIPQLHPSDLVAVATYRRSTGIDVILGFTSDRGQIRVALDSLGLPEMIDRASDPLKLIIVESDPDFDALDVGGAGPKGREPRRILPPESEEHGDGGVSASNPFAGMLNPMFKAKQDEEAMNREARKAAVDALADSFADLARLMRSVSGRKEVLLFSEGFDSALVQGNTDRDEQERVYHEGSEAGAVWRIDSEDRFGSTQAAGDLERMLEELRRSDCRVHTIDLSGLRNVNDLAETGRRGGRDSLFQIAHDTGGELYENFNNLNAAVGRMLERSGVTYVLTIQPEDLAMDGAYHPLRVELRRGATPKGARVVHRPGYFSPRPFAERGKADREMLTSSRLLTGDEPGTVPMAVLATPYPKSGDGDGTAWVPVLVEADGPALLADNGPGDLLAEIYIYAFDEQGGVRGYVAQALSLELARVETDLRRGGLRFLGHLELPPGRFNLRVLALNGRTGSYGLRTAKVEVPEMGAGKPVLLQPLFPEPPGLGVVTREATVDGQEVPFPFTQGPISYLPDPQPVLRAGEEAPVALVGYHLPAGDLRIRTQVLTADGREVAAGGLRVLGREGGPDGADRLRAAFRPSGLPPGDYLLRVTVSGEDRAERANTAPFTLEKAPGGSR